MKISTSYFKAIIFPLMIIGVSYSANPTVIKWTPNSRGFNTGNVVVPGTGSNVSFDSIFEWEELKDGGDICKLRNPEITINGTKIIQVTVGPDTFDLYIEVEGFSAGDQLRLDGAIVNGAAYNAAINGWVPNASTATTVGGKNVTWTWKDQPQPIKTAIDGEGDAIDLQHNSPSIIVRRVVDAAGNERSLRDSAGNLIYPGGFAHAWGMNHSVRISP